MDFFFQMCIIKEEMFEKLSNFDYFRLAPKALYRANVKKIKIYISFTPRCINPNLKRIRHVVIKWSENVPFLIHDAWRRSTMQSIICVFTCIIKELSHISGTKETYTRKLLSFRSFVQNVRVLKHLPTIECYNW